MPKSGFTLIELIVTISIIAILSVIGVTIYSGVQKTARDSRRIQEVQSIIKAMESHYLSSGGTCESAGTSTSPTYCPLQNNWFASAGVSGVPKDPKESLTPYCIAVDNTAMPSNATTSTWATAGSCASPYVAANVNIPANSSLPFAYFKVCTLKEGDGQVFCLGSSQN
ncbi:prepilin-type N-terminal cleavage/methylation domain-containing protein [Candidatus Daviesbacteria bacterium]|nr:prepilin-type N-terminal cleavage/methylation domain-containing protein [Candidatus Daviesbacteria bacterium]